MIPEVDVVIVGSRCAGSSTAISLAQRELNVVLVDKAQFPSDTVSTHCFGALEAFQALGVLEQIRATDSPALDSIVVAVDDAVFHAPMMGAESVYCVPRTILDALLIEQARAYQNVQFLQATRAIGFDLSGDYPIVKLQHAGRKFEMACRIIVGADGRQSFAAKEFSAEPYYQSEWGRSALYAYVEGLEPWFRMATEFHFWRNHIIYVWPCGTNRHCIMVAPPKSRQFLDLRAPARFWEFLQDTPVLGRRLGTARIASPIRGVRKLNSFLRPAYGPGWCLVGDAGASVHPLVAVGIDNAVTSGITIAETIVNVLNGGDRNREFESFQKGRDQRVKPAIRAADIWSNFEFPNEATTWLRLFASMPDLIWLFSQHPHILDQHLRARQRRMLEQILIEGVN